MKQQRLLTVILIVLMSALTLVLAVPTAHAEGTILVTVTQDGITATLESGQCVHSDGTPKAVEIVVSGGAFMSNGQLGSWVNLVASNPGTYAKSQWSYFHICAGGTLETARQELYELDPNASANPEVEWKEKFSTTIVVTIDGVKNTLFAGECVSGDGTKRYTDLTVLKGAVASNGQDDKHTGSDWANLVSQHGPGKYEEVFWGFWHLCAGPTQEDALNTLLLLDPNAATNPTEQWPWEQALNTIYLPLAVKN